MYHLSLTQIHYPFSRLSLLSISSSPMRLELHATSYLIAIQLSRMGRKYHQVVVMAAAVVEDTAAAARPAASQVDMVVEVRPVLLLVKVVVAAGSVVSVLVAAVQRQRPVAVVTVHLVRVRVEDLLLTRPPRH